MLNEPKYIPTHELIDKRPISSSKLVSVIRTTTNGVTYWSIDKNRSYWMSIRTFDKFYKPIEEIPEPLVMY